MATYLKFTTQAEADTAADEIFYNLLLDYADQGSNDVGDFTTDYNKAGVQGLVKATAITDLTIYGKTGVNNIVDKTATGTNKYAIPTKAVSDAIWWFAKPDISKMTNVTGHTEITVLDPTWLPVVS